MEIERDMYWRDWIRYLDASIEAQEQDDFRFWVSAGGDPKKFRWRYRHRGAMSSADIGEKITSLAKDLKIAPVKGDVYDVAKRKGLMMVRQIVGADGEIKYVDEDGNEVSPPEGSFFVPSARATQMLTGANH